MPLPLKGEYIQTTTTLNKPDPEVVAAKGKKFHSNLGARLPAPGELPKSHQSLVSSSQFRSSCTIIKHVVLLLGQNFAAHIDFSLLLIKVLERGDVIACLRCYSPVGLDASPSRSQDGA